MLSRFNFKCHIDFRYSLREKKMPLLWFYLLISHFSYSPVRKVWLLFDYSEHDLWHIIKYHRAAKANKKQFNVVKVNKVKKCKAKRLKSIKAFVLWWILLNFFFKIEKWNLILFLSVSEIWFFVVLKSHSSKQVWTRSGNLILHKIGWVPNYARLSHVKSGTLFYHR